MDEELYEKFKQLEHNEEAFQAFSVNFMSELIKNIQDLSAEFIRGFHFFTLNDFRMVNMITNTINFREQ